MSESISEMVVRVQELLESAQDHEDRAKKNKTAARDLESVIQQHIRGGRGTGNPLQDFALMQYGISDNALGILEALDQQVHEHPGELILFVVHKNESSSLCTGMGRESRDSDYYLQEEWYLAVIDGSEHEGLQVSEDMRNITVPSGGKHLFEGAWGDNIRDSDVSLSVYLDVVTCLDVELPLRNSHIRDMRELEGLPPAMYLQVFIGNDEVEQWVAEQDELLSRRFQQRGESNTDKLLRFRAHLGAPATF